MYTSYSRFCTHAHTRCAYLIHLFMEDSGESTDQMQSVAGTKIALVSLRAAIATGEDSIYIRNFCSLTANIRRTVIYIIRAVNSRSSVRSRVPAVAVCIFERVLPLCRGCGSNLSPSASPPLSLSPHLVHYKSAIFSKRHGIERSTAMRVYARTRHGFGANIITLI